MAHIKKLVAHGFKSFAKKTEIPFDKGINVIIGPNGSGKSNISDAMCFALGRLSAKSMRAEKAKNLIFMGSKFIKPAKEAFVELYFDNSDKAFNIDKDEIILRRSVKFNGPSSYKINGETKTRTEMIETLAQAGIDPYGFNLILQGQIQSIVKMHGDERRKIIGEVAGISVYEWRKEKSIKELEKTDSRLKEISTILRERTSYLNNLEKEKSQAQRYKELQNTVSRAKASMLKRKHDDKKKEIIHISKAIEEKMTQRDKKQEKSEKVQETIDSLNESIEKINSLIKKSTGLEQGKLREEITNLKADLEGLRVRKEGYEHRRDETDLRIAEMKKSIPELEEEIRKLREESPLIAKKAEELKKKKEELSDLESQRKKQFTLKNSLESIKERIKDKQKIYTKTNTETTALVSQMEELSANLTSQNIKECESSIITRKKSLAEQKRKLEDISKQSLESEKRISISEAEIRRNHELKKKVDKLDLCPLCQTKITEQHINHVIEDANQKITDSKAQLHISRSQLDNSEKDKQKTLEKLQNLEKNIRTYESELISLNSINEKKELMKSSLDYEESLKNELKILETNRASLENKAEETSSIDEKYDNKILEIEEISSRTVEDLDTTLLYKERELEKTKNVIERSKEGLEDIDTQIDELTDSILEKDQDLHEKEGKDSELKKRYDKLFTERDDTQKQLQETSMQLSETQGEVRQIEDQMNYLKIGKAKLDGERETIEMDLSEYKGVELLPGSQQQIEERLKKSQESLATIGSINMRALEVYDQVKKEYDVVKNKVDTIQKEKEDIVKIIEEIDRKKKRTFMKTFKAINSLFSRNFSRLSPKGTSYLEIQDKGEDGDISESQVDIVVKMAKGKYFDVHSLSGGEQTLVALALLFAIQEHKPYHFYILDEIDAALDKRNSERLAGLLQEYTKSGQYIIVTHNDAVILDSKVLYGVSMHEGVSKILSLKIGDDKASP